MSAERNIDGVTFDTWLAKVDQILLRATEAFTSGDLADQPYWNWWNDGVSPREAALDALEDNGYPMEMLEA